MRFFTETKNRSPRFLFQQFSLQKSLKIRSSHWDLVLMRFVVTRIFLMNGFFRSRESKNCKEIREFLRSNGYHPSPLQHSETTRRVSFCVSVGKDHRDLRQEWPNWVMWVDSNKLKNLLRVRGHKNIRPVLLTEITSTFRWWMFWGNNRLVVVTVCICTLIVTVKSSVYMERDLDVDVTV